MTEETMGKRLAAHRKRLSLTQDALAEKLGVTAQAISKWENDQSCPDIAMLPKLAREFGTSVDALLGLEPPLPEKTAKQEDKSEQEEDGWKVEWGASRMGSLAVACWVLLAGGLLLYSNIHHLGADLWDLLWSTALTVFAGYAMLRRFTVLRMGCMLFGVQCVLSELHKAPFVLDGDLVLPLCLLLIGFSLLEGVLRRPKRGHSRFRGKEDKMESTMEMEGERFCCSTGFGEDFREINLPRLSSGEATVSFGELTVDLTACEAIVPGCRLKGTCSFGELEFRVPRSCRVENSVRTSIGTAEVEGAPEKDATAVIYLEGSVSFGELKIKYI